MKKLIIVGIAIAISVAIYLPIHYYYPFLGIGSTTESFIFFESEEAKLRYQLDELSQGKIEEVEIVVTGSLMRKAIDSDLFTHDEKLKAIELNAKYRLSGQPHTENVIIGKNEYENDEPITFTWLQFGWGYPCPSVSIQVQIRSSDKPFYEHEKTVLCPVIEEDSAFFYTFTEEDFPDFPRCAEWGEYVIRAENQFGTFEALHGYLCKGPSVANDVINIEPGQESEP